MSLADEYRRRAVEAEGLAAQYGPREAERWTALARSWRTLADRLESEDTEPQRAAVMLEFRRPPR